MTKPRKAFLVPFVAAFAVVMLRQAFGFVVVAADVAARRRQTKTRRPSHNIVTRCSSSKHCNTDGCVEWLSYNIEQYPAADFPDNVVGTERQVACRVLMNKNAVGDDDDGYEFGTVDLDSSPLVCNLHTIQQKPQQQQHQYFEIAIRNEEHCGNFHWAPMAFDVDPLGPNIVRVGRASIPLNKDGGWETSDIGICKYDDGNQEHIGRMFLQGKYFGHCGYLKKTFSDSSTKQHQQNQVFVGGNFQVLSAILQVKDGNDQKQDLNDDDDDILRNKLMEDIEKRIQLYLSEDDKKLIESISGYSVEELTNDLNIKNVTSIDVLSRILSMDRFIPHDTLNTKGLSLLRALLAEQMTRTRRRQLELNSHPDTVAWERDGVLLKDFDYYTDKHNEQEFEGLLQMVAASKSVSVGNFEWVERNVTSVANDPQREPHIDTFHSVVKMWVYEKGVVTNATGPLHFMKGSNRNTRSKLEWIYNVSLPPATEAIKEPSLRFRGDSTMFTDMNILRPVLPLNEFHRTLVIADTSGIHHRGLAVPGTVRKTIRLSSGNDGGLPRINPYMWDGWDKQKSTEEEIPECFVGSAP